MPTKNGLQKSFEEIGVKPVSRKTIIGHDILFADGFVKDPYPKLKKFGIEKDDFPNGCYTTVWLWSKKEDEIGVGLPLFFKPLHDISHALSSRKTLRLNSAIKSATFALTAMKEASRNAK